MVVLTVLESSHAPLALPMSTVILADTRSDNPDNAAFSPRREAKKKQVMTQTTQRVCKNPWENVFLRWL